MTGCCVQRIYVGTYGSPARKRFYYMLKTKEGDLYRIRKYDVQEFIKKGAKYEEK